jgi:exosortase A-associated hydrolase 2
VVEVFLRDTSGALVAVTTIGLQVQETPFFFDRGPWRLFAIHHEPRSAARRLPFLFCHPFAEEKLWAHRVYVSFARELARRGHPVLRFDYVGNGDSSGSFTDSSIDTASADIAAAIDVLKQCAGTPRVGLLGLRLGGSLAFRAASARDDVDALVLWSPIVDGARYLQELLRVNLTTQMAVYREIREDREALGSVLASGGIVNVDGYEITRAMADGLGALSLATEPTVPTSPCFMAQIERSEKASVGRDLETLRGRLSNARLQVIQEDPFWKEIVRFYDSAPALFANTLAWLEDR